MLIFYKRKTTPIMVPDIYFTDIYNQNNRYSEMNPSMYIDENGNVTILVRCVNYKKIKPPNFTLYESTSKSKYYLLRGKINEDIENYHYKPLNINYGLPTYRSYWEGIEDVRFIDDEHILTVVPELNETGNPTIFKAHIKDNIVSQFEVCYPNITEKNWMPFEDKVIYSLNPFIIKSVQQDDKKEILLSEENKLLLKGYHGSTNGINVNGETLFLIHINKERVIHRWLLYKNGEIRLSKEFTFFKHSRIEFACSLCKYKDQIFVSLGVNDEKAYIIETSLVDIINTFTNQPTIISMFYNVRALETNQSERNRKADSYIDYAKKFLLQLPYQMILYTDSQYVYDIVYDYRRELGLIHKTRVCLCAMNHTYFYKYLDRISDLQKKFCILNGELNHETPLYIIANNNKFDCIDKTLQLNPFKSKHFVWIDFGINHVAQNTEKIHEWIFNIPDKIKQLCINPYLEKDDPKTFFQYIYHHTAGGLFSGSVENMRKYSRLFKAKTEQIYREDWYQLDEAVMTMIQRENPEMFDLYYGDYQGIVSNYHSPIHNLDLISTNIQKYIDYNNTKEAFDALCYCEPYYKNNKDELVYTYIIQHLVVDYYNNNKKLTHGVIEIINKLKDSEKLKEIILINENNINFYENKHLIKLNEYKNIIIN